MISTMDQADLNLPALDSGIVTSDGSEEVEDLTRRLHSGITATDHRKTEQASACFGSRFQVGFLDPADNGGPQEHGVADVLHEKGVLGHSRNPAQIDGGPESKHQISKAERSLTGEGTGIHDYPTFRKVDRFNFTGENSGLRAEKAQRVDHVSR